MKIYRMAEDYISYWDHKFATAYRIGTWGQDVNGKRIPVLPTIIEWDAPDEETMGTDLIGNFTNVQWGLMVKLSVGEELQKEFKDFDLVPIEMYQNPKLKKPSKPNKRTKKRIWLPYEGPELREIWIKKLFGQLLKKLTILIILAKKLVVTVVTVGLTHLILKKKLLLKK